MQVWYLKAEHDVIDGLRLKMRSRRKKVERLGLS